MQLTQQDPLEFRTYGLTDFGSMLIRGNDPGPL